MLKQVMNINKRKFYILLCILYVTQLSQCKVAFRRDDGEGSKEEQPNSIEANDPKEDLPNSANDAGSKEDLPQAQPVGSDPDDNEPNKIENNVVDSKGCWISLNEQSYFEKMSQLEQKYKSARQAYTKNVDTQQFNQKMVDAIMHTRGIAERALQKFKGNPNVIPAGLNLGSYCMMRMQGSVLFFYRMKLRNDTRFTVNYIQNDMKQLTLTLRMSLNDLHLVGEYERALTSKEDPSKLYYRPNKGEVEFLLKNVLYKVEGRYRLLDGRLHLEHIISDIPPMQILMRYTADNEHKSMPLDPNILRDYLNRMQNDLDQWLKDYFNDYLMLYGSEELKKNNEMQEFENEKTILLNHFADQVTGVLNGRLREKGPNLMMPNFLLTAANGMEIRLYDGVVRGLDTMYRRSVTTGKYGGDVRYVDADIGFSKLKAEYRYDTYVKTGMPPVSGVFVLNAEDVIAHMALQIVGYKPSVSDLLITYMKHGKPESLTIEGPASRIVANFKHLLEHHIISIMSSTLIHHIRYLSSLTKCDPQLPIKSGEANEDSKEAENERVTQDNLDITPAMKSDADDEPTESPDSNDAEPTEIPENKSDDNTKDDDKSTELPANRDDNGNDDVPPENKSDDNTKDDDKSTELPANGDDVPPVQKEENIDYEATKPQENTDDDAPTAPSDNKHELPKNGSDEGNTNDKKPEYAFVRKESIELELPSKDGVQGQSYKVDHNETFSLTKLNDNNDDEVKVSDNNVAQLASGQENDNPGKVVKLMGSDDDDSGSDK